MSVKEIGQSVGQNGKFGEIGTRSVVLYRSSSSSSSMLLPLLAPNKYIFHHPSSENFELSPYD